jgi:hypothetical protein
VDGERLTRAEFERRFDAMPELKKAQLIEGVVYMGSPVRTDVHGQPQSLLNIWLGVYYVSVPGLVISIDGSTRLDENNEPQPDVLLMIRREGHGQARLGEDGYVEGAPELAAEIAASTVAATRNAKFRAYQRNGIREYLIWRTEDEAIDWFILRDGQYVPLAPGNDGILRSEVFPGLWLDPASLVRLDMPRVMAVLQQGIASAPHAEFVRRLAAPLGT